MQLPMQLLACTKLVHKKTLKKENAIWICITWEIKVEWCTSWMQEPDKKANDGADLAPNQ